MIYAGVDIGGTKCAVTIGRAAGERLDVLYKRRFDTLPHDPDSVLARLDASIQELQNHLPDGQTLGGIGISCGGPLDSRRGVILSPPNLPGWDAVPIVEYFHDRYGVPVHLQNDANACAVAEWKFGAGRGCENMVFLTFGTGLGAGLILNGHLYEGTTGMAGELGHWRLRPEGPVGYGKAGSFEGFCSGAGIADAARHAIEQGRCRRLLDAAGSPAAVTARLVAELAKQGDAECTELYTQCGSMLGYGLAMVIDILNPQKIILGGIFARSESLLRPHMHRMLENEALPQCRDMCRIEPAALGEAIGDYAALTVAMGGYA